MFYGDSRNEKSQSADQRNSTLSEKFTSFRTCRSLTCKTCISTNFALLQYMFKHKIMVTNANSAVENERINFRDISPGLTEFQSFHKSNQNSVHQRLSPQLSLVNLRDYNWPFCSIKDHHITVKTKHATKSNYLMNDKLIN